MYLFFLLRLFTIFIIALQFCLNLVLHSKPAIGFVQFLCEFSFTQEILIIEFGQIHHTKVQSTAETKLKAYEGLAWLTNFCSYNKDLKFDGAADVQWKNS